MLFTVSTLSTLFLAFLYWYQPEPVATLITRSTDTVSRFSKPVGSKQRVVVVSIDDRSLEQYGQWPWPRSSLAELLGKINEGGAAVIGVDILLSENGRAAYANNEVQISGEEGDQILSSVLSAGPFVLGYSFRFGKETELDMDCRLHPVSPVRIGQKGAFTPYSSFYHATDVVCNLESFMEAVEASGFFNGTPDSDGVLRRIPLIIGFQDKLYPSFVLSIINRLKAPDTLILSRDKSQVITLHVGSLAIPTDNNGNIIFGRSPQKDSETVSARAVLEGTYPKGLFHDAVVLVGITAAGLAQEYVTPLSPSTSSVLLHKNVIESVLSETLMVRTPDFLVLEILATGCVCFILLVAAMYLPIFWIVAAGVSAVIVSWSGAVWILKESGYLFSPLLPIAALIVNTSLLITIKYRQYRNEALAQTDNALSLLEMSRQDLSSILKTVPDIIYRLDPEGRITFISPAVERYGLEVEELLGKSIFDLVALTDINKAKHRLNERRTGERATSGLELNLRLPEAMEGSKVQKRYFSVSAEGIYNKDNSVVHFEGTQGIIRDITRQRQLEVQLLKAQKQEVIGNLASRFAHDLNNILTGLVSYPDLLLHELDHDDPIYPKISVIQKSGKRAANIVQDLITLAGRSSQAKVVCDVANIIRECAVSAEVQLLRRNNPHVRFSMEVQKDLMKVKGIEIQLSRAVMTLFRNGVESMQNHENGELTVSACDLYLDTEISAHEIIPGGEYVCLTVLDTGDGMGSDELHSILEPFSVGGDRDGVKADMEMIVLWTIIKNHNGYLEIKSELGEGTQISVYFPATREKGGEPEPVRQVSDFSGSETILVVDDSADQLEIASGALNKLGYTVLTAVSGEQALKVLERHSVELILMDMVMPGGLGGVETYREVLLRFPGQKAIMTSGYFEPDDQDVLRDLGVEIFLEKPYSLAGLGASVRKALDTLAAQAH